MIKLKSTRLFLSVLLLAASLPAFAQTPEELNSAATYVVEQTYRIENTKNLVVLARSSNRNDIDHEYRMFMGVAGNLKEIEFTGPSEWRFGFLLTFKYDIDISFGPQHSDVSLQRAPEISQRITKSGFFGPKVTVVTRKLIAVQVAANLINEVNSLIASSTSSGCDAIFNH